MTAPSAAPPASKSRLIRLVAASLLLLAYGLSAATFFRVCTEVRKTDPTGLVTTEMTCAPPTPTSATVVILLLGILLLLWPDVSEISVLGI